MFLLFSLKVSEDVLVSRGRRAERRRYVLLLEDVALKGNTFWKRGFRKSYLAHFLSTGCRGMKAKIG